MRLTLNHIALATFFLLFLAIVDSCQGVMDSSMTIRVLSGGSAHLNGSLDSTLPDLERLHNVGQSQAELDAHLAYESENPLLYLRFLELKGRMWRAELMVPANAGQGDFQLVVHQKDVPTTPATPRFTIRVFSNASAMKADAPTFSERHLGVRPLWLVIGLIPLGLLMLWLVYRQNDREERLLLQQGVGAIFKMAKHKDHWEVVFGLGSNHGVRAGQELLLLDRQLQIRGSIVAEQVNTDTSASTVPLDSAIRPDYLVALSVSKQS